MGKLIVNFILDLKQGIKLTYGGMGYCAEKKMTSLVRFFSNLIILLVAILAQEDDGKHIGHDFIHKNSWPEFHFNDEIIYLQHTKVETGITFSRDVVNLPPGASFDMKLDDSSHCVDSDIYGDNTCHFTWGENLGITINSDLNVEIQADDYLLGEIKIDTIVPYNFRCHLCGEDCILKIPVIKRSIVIPMPKVCPVESISQYLIQKLQDHSPVPVEVKLSGKLFIVQGRTGTNLAEVTVDVYVK